MATGSQYKRVLLGVFAFAAGTTTQIKFDKLGSKLGGFINNLRGIEFDVAVTPTTSSGSPTAVELNRVVKTLNIKDGLGEQRFLGSFASLRAFEAMENGMLPYPEPDAAASGDAVNFNRFFDLALAQFEQPHDFTEPCALWQDGVIEIGWGALTDVTANTTGIAATVTVTALVFSSVDFIIGARLERKELGATRDIGIPGEARYAFLGLAKTSAFGAYTAGDIGKLAIGTDDVMPEKIDRRVFEVGYLRDFRIGGLSQIHGDPRAATDDNPKVLAGTALAAATSFLQPVIWSPLGARLSKIEFETRQNIILSNDGTLTSFYALMSRILPRSSDLYERQLAMMKNKLGADFGAWAAKTPTLKDKPYRGQDVAFMPRKHKRPAGG